MTNAMSDLIYEPRYRGHVERAAPPGRPAGAREPARESRVGVMLHFDGSGSDAGGLSWFTNPLAWSVGYHYYVFDDGSYHSLGPPGKSIDWAYESRVYHAGRCRPSETFEERAPYRDANSAFVGIATAATDGDDQDPVVELAVAALCRMVFDREGWDPEQTWRVTGHENEAWPRGRKHDPTGLTRDGRRQVPPVLDTATVRKLIPVLAA